MLNVKQGTIFWVYGMMTWDWTQVSRAIGEHSNHQANVRYFWEEKKKKISFHL